MDSQVFQAMTKPGASTQAKAMAGTFEIPAHKVEFVAVSIYRCAREKSWTERRDWDELDEYEMVIWRDSARVAIERWEQVRDAAVRALTKPVP